MTYIILETQTNNGTTAIVPPVAFTDRNEAESRYHSVLASAAVQTVEEHAAIMITNDGCVIRNECYRHEPQPEEPAEA